MDRSDSGVGLGLAVSLRLLAVGLRLLAVSLGLLAVGLGLLAVSLWLGVSLGLLAVGAVGGGLGDDDLALHIIVLLREQHLLFHLSLASLAANAANDGQEQEEGEEGPEDPAVLAPAIVAAVVVVVVVPSAAVVVEVPVEDVRVVRAAHDALVSFNLNYKLIRCRWSLRSGLDVPN